MAVGASAVSHNEANAYTHLMDPRRKWYNNRRLIALNAWIVLLLITSSTNGYDGSMVNGLQSLPQWEQSFNNPTKGKLGLLSAIQNIGALAGYPFAPYLSDGIGRRATVFIGALIMVIATVIQTAAQSVGMFIGARFIPHWFRADIRWQALLRFDLLLKFTSCLANAAPMLVTELSYPKYRASLTSAYNSLWYSGAIVAAWTTFGTFKINSTWSWRVPSALQALPSVLQVLLVWFVPESPRYLVSKGRETEALKTLAYYHADSNEDDPLVRYEFEEIKSAIEFDKTVAQNIGWHAFISSPGNRKRVRIIVAIAFFSQWSGNGLVSYYLNKVLDQMSITNPTTQLLINGILSIWNLGWALAASSMVERFGRRLLFLTSAVLMTIFLALQTACFGRFRVAGDFHSAHAALAFIFLFYAAYDIAFSPLIVTYTLEILPYKLRAKGFNIFNFTISLALIFNQYVNPIAFDALSWKYYIVYCAWLVCETIFLYFFVIETKNRTLEETAALFDGEDATEQIADAAAKQAGAVHDILEDSEKAASGSAIHEK
ncbi:Lactose permease [Mycena indigotica]|uniref:Lactose permease n=1 Tax=Mycena indigotica TaxID=2126181 RepID=A0A8H6S1W0_9AGAR|nr:Lactose permease [Mycena indigotica]KAF7291133.1 Lactose permease [Mycena indigotica]